MHASQRHALAHISTVARARRGPARAKLDEILAMANLAREDFELATLAIKKRARVALHFHPDRPNDQMSTVAEALLESGLYKSQFETKLSNGSVSAFPGGARDRWEQRLFDGAYQIEGTTEAHRPKYGALDLMRHADGPSPRFGSCYFLLSPEVSARSTFTYLDSHYDPPEKGTYLEFDDILSALFSESFTRDSAIGERNIEPGRLLQQLLSLEHPYQDPALGSPNRNLNQYIEAQVHGEIDLTKDVDILVADPSFRATPTGATLEALCVHHKVQCFWHQGFALAPKDVPANFRGPKMPSLAERIAVDDRIDAATIGRACIDLKRDPARWADRGTYAEILQELKLMWHVLVRFGRAWG